MYVVNGCMSICKYSGNSPKNSGGGNRMGQCGKFLWGIPPLPVPSLTSTPPTLLADGPADGIDTARIPAPPRACVYEGVQRVCVRGTGIRTLLCVWGRVCGRGCGGGWRWGRVYGDGGYHPSLFAHFRPPLHIR